MCHALFVTLLALIVPTSSSVTPQADDAVAQEIMQIGGELLRNTELPDSPITAVKLDGRTVSADLLSKLYRCEKLFVLSLRETSATDESLKLVGRMRQLTTLVIAKTKVTSKGVRELCGLEDLQALSCADTAIDDEGVKALHSLKKLKVLSFAGCSVTDAGVNSIVGMQDLEMLALDRTKVSAKCLPGLKRLTKLKVLSLKDVDISDSELEAFASTVPHLTIKR